MAAMFLEKDPVEAQCLDIVAREPLYSASQLGRSDLIARRLRAAAELIANN
jgi:hypothetical protein